MNFDGVLPSREGYGDLVRIREALDNADVAAVLGGSVYTAALAEVLRATISAAIRHGEPPDGFVAAALADPSAVQGALDERFARIAREVFAEELARVREQEAREAAIRQRAEDFSRLR